MELGLQDVEVRRLRRTLDKLQPAALVIAAAEVTTATPLDEPSAASIITTNELYGGSVVAEQTSAPQPQTMRAGLDQPFLQASEQRAPEFGDCSPCVMCCCCGGWWAICGIAAWVHECNAKELNNAGHASRTWQAGLPAGGWSAPRGCFFTACH
eukprot:COSAG04_NODE_226_length_19492_cov_9.475790_8_plen_154_part_00